MNERIYMSKEGLLKLEAELKRLKYKERPILVAEIKRTRELGDLSENAEYHAAKEAQVHLERKISDIEFRFSRVQLVDTSEIPDDKAYLYANVTVKDLSDGEKIIYKLVSPDEAEVDKDIISIQSPVGAAILGKEVGDKIQIKVPAGTIKYEIVKISRD